MVRVSCTCNITDLLTSCTHQYQDMLLSQVATTTWYGTGPLMCMLSTVPPVLSACAFMRSTSSMIVASFPARVHGTNRLRGAAIFQSGRRSASSSRKTLSSTSDYTYPVRVSAKVGCAECARRTHVFLWVRAIEVKWLLQRDGRVRDEARNAQVVLRRGVRLRRRQSPTCPWTKEKTYHERVQEDHIAGLASKLRPTSASAMPSLYIMARATHFNKLAA